MDDAADAVGGARNSTVNPLLYRRGEVLDSTQYGDTPPDLAKYDRTPCRGALQAACCCCARCGREELARHRAEAERARPPWRDYVLMSHPLTFMTEPAIEKARFDGTVWPSTADRFCVLLLPLLWSLLTSYGVYYGLISNPCAQVQRCYAACVATRPYAVPSDYLPISEFGGAQMCGETDYPFWQRSEWERRSYFLDYSGLVEAARLADADPSQLGPSPDLAAGSAARDSLTWEDVATRCVEAMDDLKNSRGTVSAQDVDTCHRPCVDARDSDYSAASLDQRPTCAELHHNASKYGLTHWPAPGDLVPPVGLCWSPQSVPDCEKNGVWPSTWVVQLAQSTLGVISTVVVTSMWQSCFRRLSPGRRSIRGAPANVQCGAMLLAVFVLVWIFIIVTGIASLALFVTAISDIEQYLLLFSQQWVLSMLAMVPKLLVRWYLNPYTEAAAAAAREGCALRCAACEPKTAESTKLEQSGDARPHWSEFIG